MVVSWSDIIMSVSKLAVSFSDLVAPTWGAIVPAGIGLGLSVLLLLISKRVQTKGNAAVDAPYVGSASLLFRRSYFFREARAIIKEGHGKVIHP